MKMITSLVAIILILACNAGAQVRLQVSVATNHTCRVLFNQNLDDRFWQETSVVLTNACAMSLSLPATNGQRGFYKTVDTVGRDFWYGWTWNAQFPTLQAWGIGTNQLSYVHNDRPYDWYVDQALTGPCSGVNCGPSSTAMACKWCDRNTTATAMDARNTYPEGNGWWYTYDVDNYLTIKGVSHNYYSGDFGTVTNLLAQGNIVILCLNMSYVPTAANRDMRVHSFYSGVTGHFIVVKGYRVTDSGLWFECYDPNDWGNAYADGTPSGRDRHYGSSELMNAVTNWWPYCIAVHPPSGSKSPNVRLVGAAQAIDNTKIPAASGQ